MKCSCVINHVVIVHCLITVVSLSSLAVVQQGPAATTFKIGVILPFDGDERWALTRTRPAIDRGVRYSRRRILPPGYNLTVVYRDSRCSDSDGPLAAIDLYYRRQADVFVGPACDYVVAPVARYSARWNIPVITGGAWAQAFYDKSQYSLLTRIAGSHANVGRLVVDILVEFGWTIVGLIYQDNLGKRKRLLGRSMSYFTMEPIFLELKDIYRRKRLVHYTEPWNKPFDDDDEPRSFDFNSLLEDASKVARSLFH